MSRCPIVVVPKFIGTISLGLLTGVSYTLSTQTLPTLLAFPSAATAHHSLQKLQSVAKRHLHALSGLSIVSLSTAYFFSPPRGRHPYLLWTSLMVALSAGVDFALQKNEARLFSLSKRQEQSGSESGELPLHEAKRAEEGYAGAINGEEVKSRMEAFQLAQTVRACVAGIGFLMGVVGIWGDGA
ncbi:hypothetical protein L228DRAFT_261028 [Xylona heveae TC161]|uniref:Uncharacterized protein n=1 Tax=Xylona heveae (strain CBS 132557 / TC161) TaxID=1328760 RepID=A0A161TB88_XYLHT|nr:hypothetical protein L228DRAFT_261028 [Xylona heveae TC161]KZF22907.1 hypothetical protein L228DRAFT_261028 [Xylona heveae TC161]